MSEVHVFEGNAETIKEVNGVKVNLSTIENWEELDDLQQVWLSSYFDNFPNQSLTSINTGVNSYKLTKWKSNSKFVSVFEFIEQLKQDELAKIHYDESKTSSKVRGQVLKAIKAKGYEQKESTTNNLNINGEVNMANFLKALKEG